MHGWAWLALLAALVQPAPQATPLPILEDLVRRHLEALGGRERILAIRSLKKTGTYAYNGLEHPIVSYHIVGLRSREEIQGLVQWGTSVQAGQTVLRAVNGTQGWISDGSRSPALQQLAPEATDLMLAEADIQSPLLDHASKGHEVVLAGAAEVDGSPAYRLEVTLATGITQSWYLDAESLLVVRKEVELPGRDLERARAWVYDDYRPVNGVMMPFWIYVEEPIFAREYIFDAIEANVEIDAALFEPPEGLSAVTP
jgi:hypothetical protein